jgi:hypothetical protein
VIRWLLNLSVSLLLGISLLEVSVYAEDDASSSHSEKVDAVLVLDQSGSMLATDPLKLRVEGAKLFTQFLKKGDRLGIISFAENATVVRPLSDFDGSQIEQVGQEIEAVPATGQYTDISSGIDKAVTMLANNHRDGANTTIILMSDGKMEPPIMAGSASVLTQNLVEVTLPELKKQGTKVYTLSFSDQADKDLLQEIAAVTDAISWYTPTADKIHESFANLFLAVKKPQVVPMTKKGFKLDADVQEATFYINREEVSGEIAVVRPSGESITQSKTSPDIKWFSGQKFDVVTITQPTAGDWQLSGVTNQEGFATVLTKLRLVSEWPTNLYAQNKITLEARLFEEDKPIVLPEMSQTITFAFQVTPTDKVSEPIIRDFLTDDGKNGDKIAKDGVFSKTIEIEEAGEYKLRVLAKAPTFERNQQIPFRVKPPMVQIGVAEVDADKLTEHHDEEHGADSHDEHAADDEHSKIEAFTIILNDDAQTFKKASVDLIATDEKNNRIKLSVIKEKDSKVKYFANPADLPKAGQYVLRGILVGETKRGQEIRAESRPFEYQYHPASGHEDHVVEVVKKEAFKKEKPASPILPIILMTILNGGVFFLAMKWAQKTAGASVEMQIPEFSSTLVSEELLKKLVESSSLDKVDIESKFFTMKDDELPGTWSGVAGATVTTSKGSSDADTEPSPDSTPADDDTASVEQEADQPATEEIQDSPEETKDEG